jgi:Transposase IS116/IS110/IS902 family
MNSIVSALRFFFTQTIDRPDLARKLVRAAHPRNLPVVLSRDEVTRLLNATTCLKHLLLVGDNHDRIRSEAAFAKLCGVCPIPASSGKTQRHRLNRGGNRQANAALYRVVVTRMRGHQPTVDYVQRRTAEGKSKPEIIRCLKRYVAREIFAHLRREPIAQHNRRLTNIGASSRKRTVSVRGIDDDDTADGCRWRWPRRPNVAAAQA